MVLNSHLEHDFTDSPKSLNMMDTLRNKQATLVNART